MKAVIKEEMLGVGLSGWMADFGEALPLNAELFEAATRRQTTIDIRNTGPA